MRSGDEPVTARSPLRLRLGLALSGVVWAVAGVVAFTLTGHPGWAVALGVIALLALADAALVIRRMRQGPRFQPGRDVPPYHPPDAPSPRRPARPLPGRRPPAPRIRLPHPRRRPL